MGDYQIIMCILEKLSEAMSFNVITQHVISAVALGIDSNRWARIMKMLVNKKYVEGVIVIEGDEQPCPVIRLRQPCITFEGIMFLASNSRGEKEEETEEKNECRMQM